MKENAIGLLLVFLITFSSFSVVHAQRQGEEDCNSPAYCPAPPGECVDIGEWVGEWVEHPGGEYCSHSNKYCGPGGESCGGYDPDNPYSPGGEYNPSTSDQCIYIPPMGYCDATWWNRCCSPGGDPTPQPGTPTNDPNPTANPTPTMTNLTGAFFLTGQIDPTANAFSWSNPIDSSSLILPSGTITAYLAADSSQVNFISINNSSTYAIPIRTGQAHNIYLTIPNSSNYVCSCPASVAGDQKRCAYFDIIPTSGDEALNFYLMDASISNASWWQVFDGGVFTLNSIQSIVPYLTCDLSASCDSGIFTEQNGNFLSIGFPSLRNSDSANLKSSTVIGSSLNYVHTDDRAINTDSYVISQKVNQYGYQQLLQMAQTSGVTVNTLSAGELNLANLRSGGQIDANRDNFFLVEGDLSIDETNQIFVNSGENISIFVNGNLTISDDGNDESKITQVTAKTAANQGGFLAFIVSGDIVVDGSVGSHLNAITPNLPTVNLINAQLEGVFIADGTLTIASSGIYPDHKFIGAGTFVGWSGVNLDRQVEDPSDDTDNANRVLNNNQAIDNFIYRADLLANWPDELKSSIVNWREVTPQKITE